MATTKIHEVHTDPTSCLKYVTKDKDGNYKDELNDNILYAINENTGDIVYKTISSFFLCQENTIVQDFKQIADEGRNNRRNEEPRTRNGAEIVSWHLHQNFKGYEVDPVTANKIGQKLAEEELKGFPCVVSTHTNTNNIHNHIVFCAWDIDGRKHNNCKDFYQRIRNVSDRLCEEYGLSVLDKTRNVNLVKYTDVNGIDRYYEPTERKNNLINERKNGKTVRDLNDYKNTPICKINVNVHEENRDNGEYEIVKRNNRENIHIVKISNNEIKRHINTIATEKALGKQNHVRETNKSYRHTNKEER